MATKRAEFTPDDEAWPETPDEGAARKDGPPSSGGPAKRLRAASIFRRARGGSDRDALENEDLLGSDMELGCLFQKILAPRATSKLNLAVGVWWPAERLVYLPLAKGKAMSIVGFTRVVTDGSTTATRLCCRVQEALFLLESGKLAIAIRTGGSDGRAHADGSSVRLLSVQEVFELMAACGVPVEHYMAYVHLRRLGYIVCWRTDDGQWEWPDPSSYEGWQQDWEGWEAEPIGEEEDEGDEGDEGEGKVEGDGEGANEGLKEEAMEEDGGGCLDTAAMAASDARARGDGGTATALVPREPGTSTQGGTSMQVEGSQAAAAEPSLPTPVSDGTEPAGIRGLPALQLRQGDACALSGEQALAAAGREEAGPLPGCDAAQQALRKARAWYAAAGVHHPWLCLQEEEDVGFLRQQWPLVVEEQGTSDEGTSDRQLAEGGGIGLAREWSGDYGGCSAMGLSRLGMLQPPGGGGEGHPGGTGGDAGPLPTSSGLGFVFNVFTPGTHFKKTDPPPPGFRLCIVRNGLFPSRATVNANAANSHGIPVKYANVHGGTVTILSLDSQPDFRVHVHAQQENDLLQSMNRKRKIGDP
eukprot:jgi/Mesvir1/17830/Mv12922-RA.1